jgi:hypothetical protein
MLKNMLRVTTIYLVFTLLLTLTTVPTAKATSHDGGDGSNRSFTAGTTVPGSGTPGSGDAAVPVAAAGCVTASGEPVPCTDGNGGAWSGQCYERVVAQGPGQSIQDPYTGRVDTNPLSSGDEVQVPAPGYDRWDEFRPAGATSGAVVECASLNGAVRYFWRQSADLLPSTADLTAAVNLLIEGRIQAPEIGLAPGDLLENNPDVERAMGYVGFPAWLWAENAGPGVGSPLVLTTTVQGHTLRATAALDRIVYQADWAGRGQHSVPETPQELRQAPPPSQQVRCGRGQPAPAELTRRTPAPDCHLVFDRRGDYQLTATTSVTVAWSGAGQSGAIPVTVERSGTYHVGEIQVVIVPNTPR